MIAEPLNDRSCLDQLTTHVREQLGKPELKAMAIQFPSPADVVLFLRARPQRDDDGNPADGPRIACDVSQRVRVPAADPNCVERALLYLVLAELLDPRPVRQLATIDTPRGRHTLPIENGRPVVLDPTQTRNTCSAGLWHVHRRNAGGADAPVFPRGHERHLFEWLAEIAEEPALALAGPGGLDAVRRARATVRRLFLGWPATEADKEDLAFAMTAASRAAPLWGAQGESYVRMAWRALRTLDLLPRRRNVSWGKVARYARPAARMAGKTILGAYGLGAVADDILRPLDDPKNKPRPAPAKSADAAATPPVTTEPAGPSETSP